MTWTPEELSRWIGCACTDRTGSRIGKIADVYVDDATGEPEWLAVVTGLFGSRISFVPLKGAQERGDDVEVAYEKAMVKDSPNMDADGQLTEEEEERLYRHYGLPYRQTADAVQAIYEGAVAPEVSKLQEAGSATLNGEMSPEAARLRLRRRDAEAVDDIDLRPERVHAAPHDSAL